MALFVLGLIAWEALVVVFDIEGFILPRPSVIATTLAAQLHAIVPAALFTLGEALGGYVIGSVLGIVAALATARWGLLRAGLLPFAVAVSGTDHRSGTDHQPVVRDHQPAVEDDGGGGDRLLPGDDQHGHRVGRDRPQRDRVGALRGGPERDLMRKVRSPTRSPTYSAPSRWAPRCR